MSLEYIYPLQRIEMMTIKLESHNLKTNYFNFTIEIKGVTNTKIRLTDTAINLLVEGMNQLKEKVRESK